MRKRKDMRLGKRVLLLSMAAVLAIGAAGCGGKKDDVITITNVSYDPTRELYERYNDMFERYYKEQYGQDIKVIQSHGGSGSQARSVVEGCNADVVTLALEHDIDLISANGLIDKGWIDEFDKDSAPYTSTIVFLVRKGNAKDIKDWNDLVKDDVDEVLDERVNEAIATLKEYPEDYEIVNPSVSILAQPSVAVVDDNAKLGGTEEVSTEYLKYLYSDDAQRLEAESGYRPTNEKILAEYADVFDLDIKQWTIDDFGGWNKAYEDFFDDGAKFDEIYDY